MIVHSLRASSFMKYENLALDDLPREGTVAIRGENESGKTTIGEAISFALFGRSTRISEADPTPVINWDADAARVELRFEARGQVYLVEREVDRSGRVAARLSLIGPTDEAGGASDEPPQMIAETPKAVNEEVARLLGFGFDEFRYSFYLAQKELDLVRHEKKDNSRRVVHTMVGITALEQAAALARAEEADLVEREVTLDRDLAVAQALCASLETDGAEDEALEARIAEADATIEQTRAHLEATAGRAKGMREAVAARTDALQLWERLQRTILITRHRATLDGGRRSLAALRAKLKAHGDRVRQGAAADEKALEVSRERVDRLRGLAAKLAELESNVAVFKSALERDLAARALPEDAASYVPTTRGEAALASGARVAEHSKAAGRAKLGLVFALILTAGAIAGGVTMPKWMGKAPADEVGPVIDLTSFAGTSERFAEPLSIRLFHLQYALYVIGGLFGLSLLFYLVRAIKAGRHRDETQAALDRTERELTDLRNQLEAATRFSIERLDGVEAGIDKIGDKELTDRWVAIRARFGNLISGAQSANALLEQEEKQSSALRAKIEKSAPEQDDVARLLRSVEKELERHGEVASDEAQPSAADAAANDIEAIEARVDEVISACSQARFELDALTGPSDAVEDQRGLGERLAAALGRFFAGRADEQLKHRFFEASTLGDLTDGHVPGTDDAPAGSLEALRAALERERRLLRESLGEEAALHGDLAQLEQEVSKTKDALFDGESTRGSLQAQLDSNAKHRERTREVRAKAEAVEGQLGPVRHQIAVRRALCDLLDETIGAMKRNLGPNLSRYMARVLPRITKNRYRRVEISEDLDIKVFSGDRNEYVPLIDLSFGTCDQILLSLRLGLATALAAAKGSGEKQFLFFDEPVESFDRERAIAALGLLEDHDARFSQVFIITHVPDLPEDLFTRVIDVDVEARRLATT